MLVEVVVGGVGVLVSHPLPTCRMTENGGNTDILILWSIYMKALICIFVCMCVKFCIQPHIVTLALTLTCSHGGARLCRHCLVATFCWRHKFLIILIALNFMALSWLALVASAKIVSNKSKNTNNNNNKHTRIWLYVCVAVQPKAAGSQLTASENYR